MYIMQAVPSTGTENILSNSALCHFNTTSKKKTRLQKHKQVFTEKDEQPSAHVWMVDKCCFTAVTDAQQRVNALKKMGLCRKEKNSQTLLPQPFGRGFF